MNMSFLNRRLSIIELILIFLLSFAVRAIVFHVFLRHNERYCQSDSQDYHMSAVCMQHGNGMTRLDNQKPIYWRTPGYPAFLALMYSCVGLKNEMIFSAYAEHHRLVLWVQLCLSSFIPLLVLLLALIITHSYAVARLAAYCTIIHLGFVLASGYLLTDAIASLFFILFLIFYFQVLSMKQKANFISENTALVFAAISLALYTWMRPMGQFVGIIAVAMMFLGKESIKEKIIKSFLFLALFLTLLFPWFWRNYQLTGLFFFCPLFGLYFNVFNAPRIIAYLSGIPLELVHKQFTLAAGYTHSYEALKNAALNSPYQLCPEYICLSTALPVLITHPFIFIIDWIREVCKTTFDLFSYQLVAFHQECFKWDSMIEFLSEKITACLWATPLPYAWRMIAWSELLFYIVLWCGLFAGLFTYVIKPLWSHEKFSHKNWMWLYSALIVCSVVCQTGGFGYARLRLPIEPLLIIGGIWYWIDYLLERP